MVNQKNILQLFLLLVTTFAPATFTTRYEKTIGVESPLLNKARFHLLGETPIKEIGRVEIDREDSKIEATKDDDRLALSIISKADVQRKLTGDFEIREADLETGWETDPISSQELKEILPKGASLFYLKLLKNFNDDDEYTILFQNRCELIRSYFENVKYGFLRKHNDENLDDLFSKELPNKESHLYPYIEELKEDIFQNQGLMGNIEYLLDVYSNKTFPNLDKDIADQLRSIIEFIEKISSSCGNPYFEEKKDKFIAYLDTAKLEVFLKDESGGDIQVIRTEYEKSAKKFLSFYIGKGGKEFKMILFDVFLLNLISSHGKKFEVDIDDEQKGKFTRLEPKYENGPDRFKIILK